VRGTLRDVLSWPDSPRVGASEILLRECQRGSGPERPRGRGPLRGAGRVRVAGAGGGEAGSIEISAVKASVKDLPACAGKKICKFEYSIFADRNGNGMEDTGENVLGNTWTDPSGAGTTKASVGGGQVTWGPASGTLRYTAVVTFCDDTKGSTKGVVSVN